MKIALYIFIGLFFNSLLGYLVALLGVRLYNKTERLDSFSLRTAGIGTKIICFLFWPISCLADTEGTRITDCGPERYIKLMTVFGLTTKLIGILFSWFLMIIVSCLGIITEVVNILTIDLGLLIIRAQESRRHNRGLK